jgi:hypothetical protein
MWDLGFAEQALNQGTDKRLFSCAALPHCSAVRLCLTGSIQMKFEAMPLWSTTEA